MSDHGRESNDSVRERVAENIRKRREQLALTQAQLAQAAGLGAPQKVSSIERGDRDVKARELVAIAKALYCGIADLLGESGETAIVAWRERPGAGAKEQEARFLRLCENYHLVEEWTGEETTCELPAVNPPRYGAKVIWARSLAERVRHSLNLVGSYPASSLYQTLEERCGVKIFFVEDLHGSAACARGDFGAGIVLNADEAQWRRNFSLAHELFHLITWDLPGLAPELSDIPSVWSEHIERLANAFASSLLLPETEIGQSLRRHLEGNAITWWSLVQIAREFDVSTEALLWRLVSLERLTEDQVRAILNNASFRVLDRTTFGRISPPEMLPERFLRLLETAYINGDVSAGRIAQMTGESIAEVHRRLAHIEEEETSAGQLVCLA